ncbi:hypothetical protein K432DRAFT_364803, partial [Lepidopterella palustris CBS 459.81]
MKKPKCCRWLRRGKSHGTSHFEPKVVTQDTGQSAFRSGSGENQNSTAQVKASALVKSQSKEDLADEIPPDPVIDQLLRHREDSGSINENEEADIPPSRDVDGSRQLERALSNLKFEERQILQPLIATGSEALNNTLRKALQAAQEKRNMCEKKQWTFQFRGHTFSLKKKADTVVQWLDRFKDIGDIAAGADPIHVGLPWAGVRLLLEATLAESKQMESLLSGIEVILFITNRLRVYVDYLHRIPSSDERANFGGRLETLQTAILRFLARALQIYQKNGWQRVAEAFWTPVDLDSFEDSCRRMAEDVEIEAQNCDRLLARRALTSNNQILTEVSKKVSGLWQLMDEEKMSQILKWTSSIPYEDNHETAIAGYLPGTAEWILTDSDYKIWREERSSMILWLHGKVGCGKTTLLAHVIDSLQENLPADEAIAYFYCNRSEALRTDHQNIFRSYVKQLSVFRDQSIMRSALAKAYDAKKHTGFASQRLGWKETESILEELLRGYSRTTLVLDALDECVEGSRLTALEILKRLAEKIPNLKILVASRQDEDLKRHVQRIGSDLVSTIEVRPIREDIEKYIRIKLDESVARRESPFSVDLQDKITRALYSGSDGMFQWVALQISQLVPLEREADVLDRLGKLPKGLTATYAEIYNRIEKQDGSKPEVARRTFQWLTGAFRPLRIEEVVVAVCQDPNCDKPKPVDIKFQFVTGACQALIELDSTNHVRFCHASVREYFDEYQKDMINGSVSLTAYVCLRQLLFPGNWLLPVDMSEKAGSVLPSGGQKVQEVQSGNDHPNTEDISESSSNSSISIDDTISSDDSSSGWSWYDSGMYAAQDANAKEDSEWAAFVARTQLDKSIVPFEHRSTPTYEQFASVESVYNEQGGGISTLAPLLPYIRGYWPAHCKAMESIEDPDFLTLETRFFGVGTEIGPGYRCWFHEIRKTPPKGAIDAYVSTSEIMNLQPSSAKLIPLCSFGLAKVLEKLLEDNELDVNVKNWIGRPVLISATNTENAKVVNLLLDHGANINETGKEGETALVLAAQRGNEAIIRALLQWGPDVNQNTDRQFGSALSAASFFG